MKIIDRVVVSKKQPTNKNVIWIDVSSSESVEKHYIGGKWSEVNASEEPSHDIEQ